VKDVLCASLGSPFRAMVVENIDRVLAASSEEEERQTRRLSARQPIRFFVGQVFAHRRYKYEAVILGWDVRSFSRALSFLPLGKGRSR
jgi:hypothetical protein